MATALVEKDESVHTFDPSRSDPSVFVRYRAASTFGWSDSGCSRTRVVSLPSEIDCANESLLVTCLLLATMGGFREVRADAKADAEAVIRKHLKSVFMVSVADTMTPDGKIYVQEEVYDPTETSRLEQNLMLNSAGSVTTTAKTLTVVVDPATKMGVGWRWVMLGWNGR